MKRLASLATVVGALTALPGFAAAQDQPWLQDRRYTEGIGYRVGDLELHPGAAAEFGYDSNYLRRSDDEGTAGSLRLRITPSFSLSTLSRQRREVAGPGASPPDFEFRGSIAATYNEFFPVSGSEDLQDVMSEQRNISGTLGLQLTILPQRPWSFALSGELGRAITPSDQGITSISFNRVQVGAGGEVIWTPGSGLLDWRLGYRFGGTIFESSEFSNLTNLEHTVQTRGRWRFLPRTALMYDARLGFITYPSGGADAGNPGQGLQKTGSHPIRTQIGINGLVTPSFGVLALAGWGASFYTPRNQEDFDSVIGTLELKWYITPNPSADPAAATLALSSVAVGFNRDFFDSYVGTYGDRNRGYLNLSYFFGGRFLVLLEGGVAAILYPPSDDLDQDRVAAGIQEPDPEIRLDASLFGEYRIKDSIGINSTVRYNHNITDNAILSQTTGGPQVRDELQWQQFEAYLGVRWFM